MIGKVRVLLWAFIMSNLFSFSGFTWLTPSGIIRYMRINGFKRDFCEGSRVQRRILAEYQNNNFAIEYRIALLGLTMSSLCILTTNLASLWFYMYIDLLFWLFSLTLDADSWYKTQNWFLQKAIHDSNLWNQIWRTLVLINCCAGPIFSKKKRVTVRTVPIFQTWFWEISL